MARPILPMSDKAQQRFWAKVDRRGTDECWPWQATCSPKGYGRFTQEVTKRVFHAHRVSWSLANNAELGDMLGCHSCDNPSCVNPAHIWPGTPAQNSQDMKDKGRSHARRPNCSRRSHCMRGHELTPDNTYTYFTDGGRRQFRQCRECFRIRRKLKAVGDNA